MEHSRACGGVKATTGEITVGNRGGVWLTRTARRKPEAVRWGNNLNTWRENGAFPGMDGEKMQEEVVVMDEDLDSEEHAPVPKRLYSTGANLYDFGFTAR